MRNSPLTRQVLALIEDQTLKVDQRIDALLLVGGFAGSEYLKQRVEVYMSIFTGIEISVNSCKGTIFSPHTSNCSARRR